MLVCSIAFGAQTALAQDTLQSLVSDRETAAVLTRVVDSARARGLPTDPIIAKVRQGVLLHAAPARIVAAARAVAVRLEEARDALAPRPTEVDISAGGDALSVTGVTKQALQSIRSASPNQSVAVPLGVLAQLVASKVPTERATVIVIDLIKRGATNTQLVALGAAVSSDVERGARGASALDVRLSGLTAVLARPGAGTAAAADAFTATGGRKNPP